MARSRPDLTETTKVQLYADMDSVESFTEFYKRLGMSQKEAGSRLFAWFNQQSPLIRQHILQPMPQEVAPDIARIVLERMAEQDRIRSAQDPSKQPIDPATSNNDSLNSRNGITVYGPNPQANS